MGPWWDILNIMGDGNNKESSVYTNSPIKDIKMSPAAILYITLIHLE